MFQKSILVLGAIAAIGATVMSAPARAEATGIFAALGLDTSDDARMRSLPAGASVRHVGAPGWQRGRTVRVPGRPGTRVAVAELGAPHVGPTRHTVCSRQDGYDRHERYIGSRPICWIETR